MKKILTIILIILAGVTICFGQVIVTRTQEEIKDFYYELNNAVRSFGFITAA